MPCVRRASGTRPFPSLKIASSSALITGGGGGAFNGGPDVICRTTTMNDCPRLTDDGRSIVIRPA